jgi:hypothetical protein
VEVRCDEREATRIGREPCVVGREAGGEASAGDRIGQPLSRERYNRSADVVCQTEGDAAITSTCVTAFDYRDLEWPLHVDYGCSMGDDRRVGLRPFRSFRLRLAAAIRGLRKWPAKGP